MNDYLAIATDPQGRRKTRRRKAASVEHLRNVLEREGFTNIEFIDDDFSAHLRSQRSEGGMPRSEVEWELEERARKGASIAQVWIAAARNNVWMLLIDVGLMTYGWWRERWITFSLGLGLLLWSAWSVWRGTGRVDLYQNILRAQGCGQWPEVAGLVEKMVASSAASDPQVQSDLRFREAAVMAAAGRVADAIATVTDLETGSTLGNGLYESRVAGLFYLAGDYPTTIEWIESALEKSGRDQLQLLDAAFMHARIGDIARSQDLLAEVEERNLSKLHRAIPIATRGYWALREDLHDAASEMFGEAVEFTREYEQNPAIWPIFGMLLGAQSLSEARCGRDERARELLEGWRDVVFTSLDKGIAAQLAKELNG